MTAAKRKPVARKPRPTAGVSTRYLKDLAERTARTFVQGFLGVVTLDALTSLDMTIVDKLAVGAIAGLYAILTAFAARGTGDPESASLFK